MSFEIGARVVSRRAVFDGPFQRVCPGDVGTVWWSYADGVGVQRYYIDFDHRADSGLDRVVLAESELEGTE